MCLCMIVKDEAKIVEATLHNVLEHVPICAYSVCDTGSTDATADVISGFFAERGLPGAIHHCEWRDFGHNRTEAMDKASPVALENVCDYILMHDADDAFHGRLDIPEHPQADAYLFKFGPAFVYRRPQLFSSQKKWAYRGVLHEYAYCRGGQSVEAEMPGDYFVSSGRSGSRNAAGDKYERDAAVLEKALLTESDPGLRSRYKFYLANSYKDCGKQALAAAAYRRVVADNVSWAQERYVACLELANILSEKLHWWMKSVQFDNERIEGVVRAARSLRLDGNHQLVAALYKQFRGYKLPSADRLFVAEGDYQLGLEYEASVSCFYTGDKQLGHEACEKCVMQRHSNSLGNWKFYAPTLRVLTRKCLTRKETVSVDHGDDIILEDLRSSTPSIIATRDGYRVNIPMHNYDFEGNNYFHSPHSPSFYTTNHCVELGPDFSVRGRGRTFSEEYNGKTNAGLENLRLLADGRFTANEMQRDGHYHIVIGDYDPTKDTLERRVLPRLQHCEKNWVQLRGDEFIHSWHPLRIGVVEGSNFRVTRTIDTPSFFADVRGSTDFSGGYAFVHIVSFEGERFYYHVLVKVEDDGIRYSSPFTFEGQRVEYVTGLVAEPRRLVLTYSTMDREAQLVTVDRDVADGVLKHSFNARIERPSSDATCTDTARKETGAL